MKAHPLHDPMDRVLIGHAGAWELRQFAETDRRLAYFAAKGFAHVQLWHPSARASVVTPSRLTAGNFELWLDAPANGPDIGLDDRTPSRSPAADTLRFAAPTWNDIDAVLWSCGIAPPTAHEVRAIERWFVLPMTSPAGRLLRSWWSGEAAR